MKTLVRIAIILAVVLAVTAGIYMAGESEWAAQQLADATAAGGEGGRPMPDYADAAATLGVDATVLSEALGGFPPNYAQAAAALGVDAAAVQSAVENSLGTMGGNHGERPEGGGGGFQVASLTGFAKTVLQILLVIGGVNLVRLGLARGKRRMAPAH